MHALLDIGLAFSRYNRAPGGGETLVAVLHLHAFSRSQAV